MKRFYAKNPIPGMELTLAPAEAHHMRDVMRIADGDHVALFNGTGSEYEAVVVRCRESDEVVCRVLAQIDRTAELPAQVTVYQAVIKGERFDYAVQKCVETGASAIVPYTASRSVRRPSNPVKFQQRAQRIASEAARQCGRSVIPEVAECASFDQMVKRAALAPLLVAYEGEQRRGLRDVLAQGCMPEVGIAIGPEGGFTEQEMDALTEIGGEMISLGPRILRSESAGPYILAQIAYACGQ